jgi:hypothetical protein
LAWPYARRAREFGRAETSLRSHRVGDTGTTRDRTIWLLTLAARALSSGVAAFWVYAAIGYAIANRGIPWSRETVGLAMLIAGTAASAVFAYTSSGLGGALMLLCGITHGLTTFWTAESGKLAASVLSGGPFLLAGLLFISAWLRTRRKAALAGPPRAPQPPEAPQAPLESTQGDIS